MKKKQSGYRQLIVNAIAGVGYFVVFIEWLWLLALYLPGIFESEAGKTIFPRSRPEPIELKPALHASIEPSTVMTLLFLLAALAIVGLAIYVLVAKYIPTAARATSKVVHVATEKTVPVIAHKPFEKIPVRKRKQLTERILFWVKTAVALVPFSVIAAARLGDETIISGLLIVCFAMLSMLALMCFGLQIILSQRWKKPEYL